MLIIIYFYYTQVTSIMLSWHINTVKQNNHLSTLSESAANKLENTLSLTLQSSAGSVSQDLHSMKYTNDKLDHSELEEEKKHYLGSKVDIIYKLLCIKLD